MSAKSVTLDSVMAALRTVRDPDRGKDVMALGMIRDLKIDGNNVSLKVVMPAAGAKLASQIEHTVKDALARVAGAAQVNLTMQVDERAKGKVSADKNGVPGVKHIIAVSSGKGGVGKSTVAVNLACALRDQGHSVGLLDTDVYGPNVPTMMGVNQPPQARHDEERGELILPLEAHGVKVMSMGMLARGDQPMVWRGPMLHSVVSQFLFQVDWGQLDYLVVDMPPGTGDVQLSLTQLVPVSGAVVVTTPQEVALQDVRKAILMFEKVGVPVLGVVENMSYFVCDSCSKKHDIFGTGGGRSLAEKYRIPLLGELPLQPAVRAGGDAGTPIVLRDSKSPLAQAFQQVAKSVADELDLRSAQSGTESGAPVVNIGKF